MLRKTPLIMICQSIKMRKSSTTPHILWTKRKTLMLKILFYFQSFVLWCIYFLHCGFVGL